VARTRAAATGRAATGVRLQVVLHRRPGELARLLPVAVAFGVATDAVAAELSAGGELIVRFTVPDPMADPAEAALRSSGWDIAREDRHSDSTPALTSRTVELSNAAANSAWSQV
jgi:hypothetical protein